MEIVQNILKIAKEKKINNQKICKILNSNPNKVYDWKVGKSKPSAEDLCILSDYFGVSIDYLVGKTDKPNLDEAPVITDAPVTQEPKNEDESEKELLRIYRSLPPRIKHEVMSFMYETEDKNELERDRENYINYDAIWFLFCHTYAKEKGIREKVAQIPQKEIVVISWQKGVKNFWKNWKKGLTFARHKYII